MEAQGIRKNYLEAWTSKGLNIYQLKYTPVTLIASSDSNEANPLNLFEENFAVLSFMQ